jgi:histone acetyltransferase (RNA polymerase elongator complex component)
MSDTIRHYTIPVFIPMQGCPHDCVFCNQRHITGHELPPGDDEIIIKISDYLTSFKARNRRVEVGFFGGSFTGLPFSKQKHYLTLVQPWIENGEINSIRLSTRPDYISKKILELLQSHHVKTIELGVQSIDTEVLKQSGRGHTATDVREAAKLITSMGFELVLQMMPGLPGDTFEKTIQTAKEIIRLGADAVRIYPTIVVRNTELEQLYRGGSFIPLSRDEAVSWCSQLVLMFEDAGVKILRIGLNASEGLINGDDLIAGPFHVAFGEMVYSKIWEGSLAEIPPAQDKQLHIFVNPRQLNQAAGHGGTNKKMLERKFRSVKFIPNAALKGREFSISLLDDASQQKPTRKNKPE